MMLAELVEQYYAMLYRYAYRLSGSASDAEDLTQQTFLKAHANLSQLRDSDRAGSWLFTILRNTYFKTCRYEHRPVADLDCVPEPADHLNENSGIDTERIQNALDELPEEFRSPLILYYFNDLSYREIAEQMGVPIGTIMSRLVRGKAYLRRRLASQVPVSG